IETPTMSEGKRSLVNWMRRNVPPSAAASARASVVLPTPGMSSIRRCPRESSAITAALIASGLPRTIVAIASSSLRTAPMSVEDSGAGTDTADMSDEYSLPKPTRGPRRDKAGAPCQRDRPRRARPLVLAQAHEQLQHV